MQTSWKIVKAENVTKCNRAGWSKRDGRFAEGEKRR